MPGANLNGDAESTTQKVETEVGNCAWKNEAFLKHCPISNGFFHNNMPQVRLSKEEAVGEGCHPCDMIKLFLAFLHLRCFLPLPQPLLAVAPRTSNRLMMCPVAL